MEISRLCDWSRRSGAPPKVPSRRASLDHQQVPPKVPSRRASLDQQVLRKPSNTKTVSPRVSVSNQSTVSSLGKQIIMKEGEVVRSRLRKGFNKNPNNEEVKKSAEEVGAIAAGLPMDSLCLCLEKLQSVYHVVTCASVCRHWREAVLSDVVSPFKPIC